MEIIMDKPLQVETKNFRYTLDQEPGEQLKLKTLPFRTGFCLAPLIKQIEKQVSSDSSLEASLASQVMDRINSVPELRHPIEDLSLLDKHNDIVESTNKM